MIVKVRKEVTNPNIDQYCNLICIHGKTCFVQSCGKEDQYWIVQTSDILAVRFGDTDFPVARLTFKPGESLDRQSSKRNRSR